MHTFTDKDGRAWSLALTVSALKRVRGLLGVDLMDVAGGDLLARLADDPCLLVDVLYVLCKPEADAKGVTDEDFGQKMVGGVLDDAASALMKELLDFFPSAQRARALGKLLRVMEAQDAALKEAAAARPPPPADPPKADPSAVAATAAEADGDSSGNSLASAAATPVP